MDVLDKYISELEEDTKLDVFKVRDVQCMLPGIKHKWIGRLIRHKQKSQTLEQELNEKRNQIATLLTNQADYKLSRPMAEKAAEKHNEVVDIKNRIKDNKSVVELLEKTERVLSSMTYDIKNLVEIMKIETI